MATDALPGELLDRVQQLTAQIDELPDARARELAQELVAAVIAMYGDGLARIMDVIARSREAGATILDELSQDGAVASLLLIHDLYPVSLEERVIEALDTVRPYMESHGGNVELVDSTTGSPARAPGQLQRLRGVTGDARAGDQAGARGARARPRGARGRGRHRRAARERGRAADGLGGAADRPLRPRAAACALGAGRRTPSARHRARLRALEVDGVGLVLADVDGSLLAYVDECASCGAALSDGELPRGHAPLPGLRGRVRPAAGGARGRRRAAAAAPRCRCSRPAACGWRSRLSAELDAMIAARRRAESWRGCGRWPSRGRRRAPPTGRPRQPGAVRPVPHDAPRRPPPHAAPRRAADRLHVRGVLGAALGRRRVPPDGMRDGVARGLRVQR